MRSLELKRRQLLGRIPDDNVSSAIKLSVAVVSRTREIDAKVPEINKTSTIISIDDD